MTTLYDITKLGPVLWPTFDILSMVPLCAAAFWFIRKRALERSGRAPALMRGMAFYVFGFLGLCLILVTSVSVVNHQEVVAAVKAGRILTVTGPIEALTVDLHTGDRFRVGTVPFRVRGYQMLQALEGRLGNGLRVQVTYLSQDPEHGIVRLDAER
ncbi:MAG: hypothetical protein ACYCWW_11955 [Deltaproteobacteria bacterium]